jgi:hypothetical protein
VVHCETEPTLQVVVGIAGSSGEKKVIMEKEEPGSCMSLTDSTQVPNPLKSY